MEEQESKARKYMHDRNLLEYLKRSRDSRAAQAQILAHANELLRQYRRGEIHQNTENLNEIVDLFFDAGMLAGMLNA